MASQSNINGNVLFREAQQFRVKWLWWLLISSVLFSIGITLAVSLTDKANRGDVAVALIFVVPIEALMLYLFYVVKLETVVTSEGVYLRWLPFFKKFSFIDKNNISGTTTRQGPSMTYGFHYTPGFARVHNTGPGKGISFVLNSGSRIFIGTQKIHAFETAVGQMKQIQ